MQNSDRVGRRVLRVEDREIDRDLLQSIDLDLLPSASASRDDAPARS